MFFHVVVPLELLSDELADEAGDRHSKVGGDDSALVVAGELKHRAASDLDVEACQCLENLLQDWERDAEVGGL